MLNKRSLKTFPIILSMIMSLVFSVHLAWAEEGDYEDALFSSTAPDVFILLDASSTMKNGPGSLTKNPSKSYYWGYDASCAEDTTHCNATYGFDLTNAGNCKWDCSRLGIAKRAIYSALNFNNDTLINSTDSDSMNVRIATGKFDANGFTQLNAIAAQYNQIMCGNRRTSDPACNENQVKAQTCINTTSPYGNCIEGVPVTDDVTGGTGGNKYMVKGLKSAKNYYDGLNDSSKDCRQKFIVLITDGGENKVCNTDNCAADYKEAMNRRQAVLMAKNIAESSASTAIGAPKYKLLVFVLNDGTIPTYRKNTLDWMAFWGDPANAALNTSTSTVSIKPLNLGTFCCATSYPTADYCLTTDTGTWLSETACLKADGSTTTVANYYAPSNDPGYTALDPGYKGAYQAVNTTELNKKLGDIFAEIATATYSFTQASIQAVRTTDESFVYEATFNYLSADPMYTGHLKRYAIDNVNNGAVATTADWDAGTVLKTRTPARIIKTWVGGSSGAWTDFPTTTSSTWDTYLGTTSTSVPSTTTVINFIRNGDTAYASTEDYYAWKLGDIFHSSPLAIATPNANFVDKWDSSDPKAFYTFRSNHVRTVTSTSGGFGGRIILVGANDGQIHAFQAFDGVESWSFIPPNLLPKLKKLAHIQHPPETGETHAYFVDGPLSAAEVWTGTSSLGQTAKSDSDWHTYLTVALGRGGVTNLWSSSPSCDSGFNADNKWSSVYPHYCGYYFLDISNPSSPVYKGRIGGSSALLSTSAYDKPQYLGEPWSKMYLGRVKIEGKEKWVGLIGGGFSGSDCKGSCDTRGKGFFVVDLSDANRGNIIWSYTRTTSNGMDYDLVAGPAAADSDGDGYLDTAYIGDVGRNIWRFKFCGATDDATCNVSSWSGSKLLHNK